MNKLHELGISPTPWKAICSDYNDGRVWSVEAHNGAGIAEFDCNEEQFGLEEGFANAHLVAAAPELYESLHEIIGDMCNHCDLRDVCQEGEDGMSSPCNIVHRAKAALAKATGEEE